GLRLARGARAQAGRGTRSRLGRLAPNLARVLGEVPLDRREVELAKDRTVRLARQEELERAPDQVRDVVAAEALAFGGRDPRPVRRRDAIVHRDQRDVAVAALVDLDGDSVSGGQ